MSGSPQPPPRDVPFRDALRFWIKLGFISFGGPAGQIAIMHRECVTKRQWVSESRFLHALNYCMLLPGPEATELAIYVGWLLHRWPGGVAAGVFFVLPSVFVLLGLSYVYAAYGALPLVAGALAGIKPVVVAIVVEAITRIGGRALKRRVHWAVAAGAFVAIYFGHVPFPLIVLGAGLLGWAGGRWVPALFSAPAPSAAQGGVLLADDEVPPHAHPSHSRELVLTLVWVVLWALPYAALLALEGGRTLHAREYEFFTVSAWVTFGGAYAVLAYVTQAAVAGYGWLTPLQAVDGLGLAETTPGPLIMVLQFMGFMAGWNHPVGDLSATASGVIGALVATWTTFLPTFFYVFLGAPYMERLRGNTRVNDALSGITASVVGVILNLAIVFGVTVIRPVEGTVDVFAAVLTLGAFVALKRGGVDVLWVVAGGATCGLVRALLLT